MFSCVNINRIIHLLNSRLRQKSGRFQVKAFFAIFR
jgi:hypothetical protein